MKRMYRLIALLLILVLVLGITAQADMIWVPENGFYQRNSEKCVEYGRTHIVNSPEGAIGIYLSPRSGTVLKTVKNGVELGVSYTFDDGAWGLTGWTDEENNHLLGWIDLSQTVLKYDGQSFLEEHEDEFYEDDGTAKQMLENTRLPYTHTYPGEPFRLSWTQSDRLMKDGYKFKWLYKDENDRIWGYVGESKYGDCIWICLSEPLNSDLPVVEYQKLELYPASDIEIKSTLGRDGILAICLVGGVAVVSALLIFVLRKKRGAESWNNTQPRTVKPKTMKGRMKSLQCTGWRGDDRDFEA